MPAIEFSAWERHFQRFPPLEDALISLFAFLCSIVLNAAGAKPPVTSHDVAPWLLTPEIEAKAKEDEKEKIQGVKLGLVLSITRKSDAD